MDYDKIIKEIERDLARFPDKARKGIDLLASGIDYDVATTPADIVYTEDNLRLLHYKPIQNPQRLHQPPVLIVYALINRYIMLDLQPGRSFVQNLLNQGLDVYLLDWGRPTASDMYLDLGDHLNGYLDNVVEKIRSDTQSDQINLMGICMGGTFSVIYTALHPEKIRNLITLATPVAFDVDDATLFLWAKHMDVDKIETVLGKLPGDLANILYLLIVPVDTINKYVQFLGDMDNPKFVSTFLRMEKWIFDSPDMTGAVFRQFIGEIVQKNLLIKNQFELEGQLVDLRNIRCPLLNVYGKHDYLAPPVTSKPLARAVGSKDTSTRGVDSGHVGIFVGSMSYKTICPGIVEWIKNH